MLVRTETRARQAGCFGGGFFLFRRDPDRSCNALVPKLRDMQDNLARLDHLRRRGGRSNVTERMRELQGMMSARGCDAPGSIFESGPGGNFIYSTDAPTSGNGTFRTLCVRTCDGYYFPISFSTTSEHFPADARSCEAICPGTEARLFYLPQSRRRSGEHDLDHRRAVLVAADGVPISHQHRFRLHLPAARRILRSTAAALPAAQPSSTIRPRRCRGRAPRRGKIRRRSPTAPATTCQAPSTRRWQALPPMAVGADGRPIRIVGPAYWGNKEQDDVVIAPVPN